MKSVRNWPMEKLSLTQRQTPHLLEDAVEIGKTWLECFTPQSLTLHLHIITYFGPYQILLKKRSSFLWKLVKAANQFITQKNDKFGEDRIMNLFQDSQIDTIYLVEKVMQKYLDVIFEIHLQTPRPNLCYLIIKIQIGSKSFCNQNCQVSHDITKRICKSFNIF